MRTPKRLLARLAALVMLASIAAVAGNVTAAQADPIPPTNWAPVSLSSIPGATTVMTDANGGVTVGCQQSGSSTLFQSFASDGTKVQDQSVPSGVNGSFCTSNSTVGKDGTVYVNLAANDSSAQYVQAWKDNSLVWSYTIPCGAFGYPWAMTMGADGNLYVVVTQGSGSCNSWQLIGLTPTPQSGSNPAAPQIVMNQPIYTSGVWGQGLSAYNDGLVLDTRDGIWYVSYSGTVNGPITPAGGITSHIGAEDHWFAASTSGRVLVPNKANTEQSLGCSDPNNDVGSISAVDPTAQDGIAWTTTITSCVYVHEIYPTPTGGFVMRYTQETPNLSNPVDRVGAFDSNGTPLWDKDVTGVGSPGSQVMSVDLNGDIAIRSNVAAWHSVNGTEYQFPAIGFMLLSGFTGETISSAQFTLRGDSSTTNGPSYMWGSGGELALAKNTVYVAAYQCATFGSGCDMGTTMLYAFTVPGVDMDYPRGAILQHDVPLKVYVATGDSFSSGQGVPPYEDGTDTAGPPENRCMRSPGAYAQLLSSAPGLRLDLAEFVACGGSTTLDYQNGRFNEGPQLNAINTQHPDIVTITIGGNDIGFKELAEECITNNPWADCTDSSQYAYTRDQLDNHLASNLGTLYSAIQAEIKPTARVLVVGYPMLIPDPAINTLPNCPYLSHDEKVMAQGVITDLNQKIRDAVAAAGSQFEYVDPNTADSPFKGHELCMDGGYFNGVDISNEANSLHPNQLGQDAYRWVITRYLEEHP